MIDREAKVIGARLARIRRERGMTQVQLAARLGILQPMVSDYELGKLRLHGQLIIRLARILDTSADELLGLTDAKPSRKNSPSRSLLKRLHEIEQLNRRDRQALIRTIDAFLKKAS